VLRRLRIENLVLIREAELALAPGLNAITGETGAGKTILAQAIGLLLGARGDAALVGPDGDEAYVEAELELPAHFFEDEELRALAELRPEDEDGLVLARRVFADGRTRAYAWGRSAARTLSSTTATGSSRRPRPTIRCSPGSRRRCTRSIRAESSRSRSHSSW
jgi:DNA repair protein RecN (Recombination protein N)